MTERPHEHGSYYWNADSPHCKHGAEPDWNTDGEAWDRWSDKHPVSDDGHICLDAPAGEACLDCSTEEGDMVPWADCRTREHARPKHGIVPNPGVEHQQVAVWIGTRECLERDCEDYFTEDGDEIPGKDRCFHIREEQACSCQRGEDGEYSDTLCTATANAAA
ncbi:hypothetical protein pZL12.9c [Streptomyces phage ZL12]|uniref:Uncharacterized protein n=1 Tax=Streptomyces phage ZL12 TaxID=2570911 RepID=D0UWB4_9CAUD|nr:hypothetical protein QEH43_gp009 [Streptomyces phage ZL12]ACX71086.1 hypothetical protein pZL12.9c [Streptomyces phage ZL12]